MYNGWYPSPPSGKELFAYTNGTIILKYNLFSSIDRRSGSPLPCSEQYHHGVEQSITNLSS